MNKSVFKRYFVFNIVIFAFWILFGWYAHSEIANAESRDMPVSETASSTITNDELDNFLFRLDEDTKEKILMLSGEPVEHLPIPILFGVSVGDFTDTWGEARAGGRTHTGTDIIVSRGELVVSPTDAVVTKIGYDNRGGNFVITANPGGEQFYFAHLDRAAENLFVGNVLKPGDIIGYIGNTGNARGKSPHLHLGIYYKGLALNPFSRLVREFSIEEKIIALEQILTANKIVFGANNGGVRFLQRFLINNDIGAHAKALARTGATGYFGQLTKNALLEYQQTVSISSASGYFDQVTKASIFAALNPSDILTGQVAKASTEIIPETEIPYSLVIQISDDLDVGSSGEEVVWLQDFLISANSGPHAMALANADSAGYFGTLTKNALIEYQLVTGIEPASGYFGPITRSSIQTFGGN